MEWANTLAELVRSLGFPILMCGIMVWYIKYKDDLHKNETDRLSEAIENNTIVMTRLLDKLNEEV